MTHKTQPDILIWKALLEPDSAHLSSIIPGIIWNVTVETDPPTEVGTCFGFYWEKGQLKCNVSTDQALWRSCEPAFGEGVAAYCGPFRLVRGCD